MGTRPPAQEPVAVTPPEVEAPVADGAAPAAPGRVGQGAAAFAGDPRPGLTPGAVVRLNAAAGNAAVARTLAAPLGIGREPAGKHATTGKDSARLDNARRLIDKARTQKDAALTALTAYSAGAPGALAALKENADKNLELHKAAGTRVNYIIGEAKAIAQLQEQVIMQIAGAALGGLATALEPISEAASKGYQALSDAWGEMQSFGLGALTDATGAGGAAKGVMGMGTGGSSAGTGPDDGSGQQLSFYTSFAELQSRSTRLLGTAVQVAKVSEPIGKVDEAIRGVKDSGVTRGDYPVEKIDFDAATLESATRRLAAAAPTISSMLTDLASLRKQAEVSAPKDALEVEKELWIRWAASIDRTSTDLLDLDTIENHLKKLGIWDRLGIDRGDWFSDEEEALAVCSAKAQEMVLAHKGEAVEFSRGRFGFSTIKLDGIPGAPALPATLDPSSTVFTDKVKAVVIGAVTVGQVEEGLLKGRSKESMAEWLLNNGYIRVILRSYEDLSGPPAEGAPPPD